MSDLTAGKVQDDSTSKQWGPGKIQWWYPRFLCAGLLVFGVGAIWAYQHRTDALRTKRLELIGPDGRICAVMGAAPGGGTGLTLQDAKSDTQATIAVTPLGHSRLMLQAKDGSTRAGMEVTSSGQSTLRLFNKEGSVRLSLNVKPDGSSTVDVMGMDGKRISSFTLDGNFKPRAVDANLQSDKPATQNSAKQPRAAARNRKPITLTQGAGSNIGGNGSLITRVAE